MNRFYWAVLGVGLVSLSACRSDFQPDSDGDGAPSADQGLCDDLFGGVDGYQFCEASESSCSFQIEKWQLCEQICSIRGTSCVAGYDALDNSCELTEMRSCTTNSVDICLCSTGCEGEEMCSLGEVCEPDVGCVAG